jgi:DnaK suppressor protein
MATAKSNKSKSTAKAAPISKLAAKSLGKSKTAAKGAKANPSKAKAATAKSTVKLAGKSAAKTAVKTTAKTTAKSVKAKAAPKTIPKTAPKATAKSAVKSAAKASGKNAGKTKAGTAPKATAKKAGRSPSKSAGKSKPVMLAHIDDRTLGKIVAKLEEMREESQNIVNAHMQSDLQPREDSSDVGDDLDQASNERAREFDLIMHQRHLQRLQQIEGAFLRMDDGTYGLCEGTDEPIHSKRLLIMPLARFSLEYQEQQEKMLGRGMTGGEFSEADDSFSTDD